MVFDLTTHTRQLISTGEFKDQDLAIWSAPV
jgi:hypothetical protein